MRKQNITGWNLKKVDWDTKSLVEIPKNLVGIQNHMWKYKKNGWNTEPQVEIKKNGWNTKPKMEIQKWLKNRNTCGNLNNW